MSNIYFKYLVFPGFLQVGSEGSEVIRVREGLGMIGSDPILKPYMYEYDYAVKRAVEAFQKEKGLEVDGIVGKHTWYALVAPKLTDKLIDFITTFETGSQEYLENHRLFNPETNKFICKDIGDGTLTIGYGSTPPFNTYAEGEECTIDEAKAMFREEMYLGRGDDLSVVGYVCHYLGNANIVLTHTQYEAFVDLQYNSGTIKNKEIFDVVKAGSTNVNEITTAFMEKANLQSQNGAWQRGVFKRRYAELNMFLYNDYNAEENDWSNSKVDREWSNLFGGSSPY